MMAISAAECLTGKTFRRKCEPTPLAKAKTYPAEAVGRTQTMVSDEDDRGCRLLRAEGLLVDFHRSKSTAAQPAIPLIIKCLSMTNKANHESGLENQDGQEDGKVR